MSNTNDRYLSPGYTSPKSPYQSPISIKNASRMTRSSSHDAHRVLGYFDLPSRSAPSSPQTTSIPLFSPISRSSSPGRDTGKPHKFNHSRSGSDLDDALVGFSLVPNWLKMAMEQGQNTNQSSRTRSNTNRSSLLSSPDSLTTTSNEASPATPQNSQLNIKIPQTQEVQNDLKPEEEDQRYWEDEDEGYWGEMEEDEQDEALEEAYQSVL